jgi:hypothetical protein
MKYCDPFSRCSLFLWNCPKSNWRATTYTISFPMVQGNAWKVTVGEPLRLGVFHRVVELVGEISKVRYQDMDVRSVVFENLIGLEELRLCPHEWTSIASLSERISRHGCPIQWAVGRGLKMYLLFSNDETLNLSILLWNGSYQWRLTEYTSFCAC